MQARFGVRIDSCLLARIDEIVERKQAQRSDIIRRALVQMAETEEPSAA